MPTKSRIEERKVRTVFEALADLEKAVSLLYFTGGLNGTDLVTDEELLWLKDYIKSIQPVISSKGEV